MLNTLTQKYQAQKATNSDELNLRLHRDVILTDENFVEEAQNIHYLENHLLQSDKKH